MEVKMEKQLAKLYKQLAEMLNSIIPTQWSRVYYLGEVVKEKAAWSSTFYYLDSKSGQIERAHDEIRRVYGISRLEYLEQVNELNSVLLEMYECFAEHSQELWEQISFSLSSTGEFKVDFKYDVINEKTDSMTREAVWAYETFGRVPKEGSYSRELLEEYLVRLN